MAYKKTLRKFDSHFIIKESRGVLGYSKWYFLIRLLPLSDEKKKKIGKKLHQKDLEKSNISKSHLYKCMQLTMLMEKRAPNT